MRSALRQILYDHDERLMLYPHLNSQPGKLFVMEEARKLVGSKKVES